MTWRSYRFAVVAFCVCLSVSHAQIYRWDTHEVIPRTEGITPGPGAQLENRNLRFADFAAGLDLHDASFSNSWLDDARFTHSRLTRANFDGAVLHNADFSDADISGARFRQTTTGGFRKEQLYSTSSYKNRDLRGIWL